MRNKYSKGFTVYTPCHLPSEKSKSALSFANGLCFVLGMSIPLHYCREDLSSELRFDRKNSSPSLEWYSHRIGRGLEATYVIV